MLNFGKALTSATTINQNSSVSTGLPTPGKLSFGSPDSTDFTSKLSSITKPTTVCISVGGGANTTLASILNQIDTAISAIQPPQITIPTIPNINLPSFSPISNLVPALQIAPTISLEITEAQMLAQIAEQCALSALNKLDSLDPIPRLEQLLQQLQALCNSLQFTEMQAVLQKIEQAKSALVQNVVSDITDATQQINKLISMAGDAIQTGAQDILSQIANLISRIQFDALINQILAMDPTQALNSLNDEIRKQLQLGNINGISQLLTAVNVLQSQLATIPNVAQAVIADTSNILNSLQSQINGLLDVGNYAEIQNLLAAYSSAQTAAIQALSQLSPELAIQKGLTMLNQALKNLDLASYNQILNQLAQNVCNQGLSLLPDSSSVSTTLDPSSIPSYLKP